MYTVRVPFQVPTATRISSEEANIQRGGLSLSLKQQAQYHLLTVSGLASEKEAHDFLLNVQAAIGLLLLERGIAANASTLPQPVTYQSDPFASGVNIAKSLGLESQEPVDALLDGSEAAVYLTDKNVRFMTFGQASLYVTTPSTQALEILLAGAKRPGAARLPEDAELVTALKLYGAHFTEQSPAAKFLTLVMALEALAVPTAKSQIALELMSRWKAELQVAKMSVKENAEDVHALEALERELSFRQGDSIRSQVRKLVVREMDGENDQQDLAKQALHIYDQRSVLVHQGYLDTHELDVAFANAKALVHRVLTKRFNRLTGV